MSEGFEHEVGKAYRGEDGIVRWITHRSTRGNLTVKWLEEETNVWYSGGIYRPDEFHFLGTQEVRAPQPGETITLSGVYGTKREESV